MPVVADPFARRPLAEAIAPRVPVVARVGVVADPAERPVRLVGPPELGRKDGSAGSVAERASGPTAGRDDAES